VELYLHRLALVECVYPEGRFGLWVCLFIVRHEPDKNHAL
jgi:hypothetical protein